VSRGDQAAEFLIAEYFLLTPWAALHQPHADAPVLYRLVAEQGAISAA
jgi:hypothetical protein